MSGFSEEITGSKGDKYTVSFDAVWMCTCPGFTYRGKCKHVEIAKVEHPEWEFAKSDDEGPTEWDL